MSQEKHNVDQTKAICFAKNVNHIAITVEDINHTIKFYSEIFGSDLVETHVIEDQEVYAAVIEIGDCKLEFIQPIDSNSSIAKFIDKKGFGLHHLCLEVSNLGNVLTKLDLKGINLIDKQPREGLVGDIAFIHPKSMGGVLMELVDSDSIRRN
ncbi:MAG: methylmalonyl-CoA epimerase [SAR202 cluster bacterium]|nr:methylmalonyl-CoA epimerase [SAR202 cluster bacterium]|tara:strand:- start:47313 stop:47771 length:459 start_codon:yes stop_codon:yes gene_type:complete